MAGFLGMTLLSLKNTFRPINDFSIFISIYGILTKWRYCLGACKNDVIMVSPDMPLHKRLWE